MSEPVFVISRQYREQIRRNPKSILVIVDEIVGSSNIQRRFVGEKYRPAHEAGMLEFVRSDPPKDIKPAPAPAPAPAPVVVDEVEPELDELDEIDREDFEEPVPAVSDALRSLQESSTIEPNDATPDGSDDLSAGSDDDDDSTPAQEDEAPETAPAASDAGRPIRRRRAKK